MSETIDTFKQTKIKNITKYLFKQIIKVVADSKITSIAPLGFSGDDYTIYGKPWHKRKDTGKYGRESLIQFRMHNGDVELLITDKTGNFLFIGKLTPELGIDIVVDVFWKAYRKVKKYLLKEIKDSSTKKLEELK